MSSGLMKSIEGNPLTADVQDWTVDELALGYDVESDGDESGRGFLVQSAVSFEFWRILTGNEFLKIYFYFNYVGALLSSRQKNS